MRSAAQRECAQLLELLANHADEVSQYCWVDRKKSHGIRKAAATHSTSGTTLPPPLPSVARRGEWRSQGTVLEIYFLFAEPGDQYLGRCLAGLPMQSVAFASLPPHFLCGIENDDVRQALYLCYGNIIALYHQDNGGLIGVVLLLFLASVIYHLENFIKPTIEKYQASYPFAGLVVQLLLQYPDIFRRLSQIITTEPSPYLPQSVPPHIEHLQKLTKVLEGVTNVSSLMMTQGDDDAKRAIVEAFEERDVRGGIMTIDFFETYLQEHHHELEQMIQIGLQEATRRLDGGPHGLEDDPNNQLRAVAQHEALDNSRRIKYPVYCYDGRFWHSPRGWKFSAKNIDVLDRAFGSKYNCRYSSIPTP